MKNKIFFAVFVLLGLFSTNSFAQYNPYDDGSGLLSVGVGASGWGIPIYLRYEHPVADNITVGAAASFQTKGYTYWRGTYYGFNGRGSYHFNELLNAPDEWDFYGGASLGYYFYKWKWTNEYPGVYDPATGYFNVGLHVGARYFVKENIAINVEAGGGSSISGGTIGVTFIL